MKKILGYFRPFAHVFACTTVLMFLCGALSLGTFPALGLASLLGTSLVLSALAWIGYMASAIAVLLPLKAKTPGFAIPTVLGAFAGAAAIMITGWFLPGHVTATSYLSAVPFALVNTLAIWGSAFATGSLKPGLTFWPTR
jgi:polyferredoxin